MKFSKKLYFSLDFKVFSNVSFSSSLQTPGYFRKKMVKTFNITAILSKPLTHDQATLGFPIQIRDDEKKLTQIFIFTLLCGASKGFMKVFWGTTKKS